MKRLLFYFIRGLLITVPVVVTAWLVWQIFISLDRMLGIAIPGVGFILTLVLITVVGFLGSNLVTRGVVAGIEDMIERLPLVRLVYNATKDLIGAFVGEKKRFDKPVLVQLSADGAVRGMGFITQEALEALGTRDTVVVYFPQSYAFAGWTFVVPASRVQRVDVSSSDFMAFVVSGGVTDFPQLR
ncbi:MAG TPA: DUF502 domain-containing protein [Gemmatimonadaceae bacterium]|nr:DUF502 domain-containing protein [Gemmatimonadaceae bacterium]